MKLICYPLTEAAPALRAAPSKRKWMDDTPESFAYRCLPLTIANSHGWEVLNPLAFTARWGGHPAKEDIKVEFDLGPPAVTPPARAMSHFGSGVLTFELPFMFKTPPGWNLWVQGPVNRPKDAIAPLTGVIETDWSPYTFTMNWLFTRPGVDVRFEVDEPIAHIFPVRRQTMERIEPELRSLEEDADRHAQHAAWRDSRSNFLGALGEKQDWAVDEKWQKTYYRGARPDGKQGVKDHQIKLRLNEFKLTGERAAQQVWAQSLVDHSVKDDGASEV